MGGKAQRRREKNYNAAHGGNSRLPPPPDASSVDALPSKLRQLRKLMDLTNSSQPANKKESNLNNRRADKKKLDESSELTTSKSISLSGEDNNGNISKVKDVDHAGGDDNLSTNDKKKRKRKRKEANDLRFEKADELGVVGVRKQERKKKHREEMKNKKLNKKAKLEDDGQGFAGHENIKFGEVAIAPPKILTVPKASKASQNASKERLRLKAIDEYRNRKGWVSRPGIALPVIPTASTTTTTTSSP